MNFIHKINRYLLKRYPTIWNTKIVWMLLVAFLVHLLFFGIGYFYYSTPARLNDYWIGSDYFESGLVFIHIIFSLIILAVWLSQLLKNNAFKNFYPMTSFQLLGQFLQFIIIIFANVTFYYSFNYGNKIFINQKYDDTKYLNYIEIANKGNVFLPVTIDNYLLDKRILPEPYDNLYLETKHIDFDKPYFTFKQNYYQFYNVKIVDTVNKGYRSYYAREELNYTHTHYSDSLEYIYHKDQVVDVSKVVKNAKPNFRNFSNLFIVPETTISYSGFYAYDKYDEEREIIPNSSRKELALYINKILNENDKTAIQKIIDDFIQMSNELGIERNFSSKDWFSMIYHPETDFEVTSFFKSSLYEDKDDYRYQEEVIEEAKEEVENAVTNELPEDYTLAKYRKERLSNYYYDFDSLKYTIENIGELKKYSLDVEELFIYLWFSIAGALLLFGYRMFNLKTLLISGVTIGVVILLCSLFVLFVEGFYSGTEMSIFLSNLTIFIYLIFLSMAIFLPYNGNKTIKAIIIYTTLVMFPLFVMSILNRIDEMQKAEIRLNEKYDYYDEVIYHETLFNSLSTTELNLLVLFSCLIFWFFCMKIIRKWRASSQ